MTEPEKSPDRHVTLKHVSEAAGVSIQTASHVLNPRFRGRYHPQTRQKVLDAAATLNYRPNAAARSMLTRRSHIIGVLVPTVDGAWFGKQDMFETILGMNEPLAAAGYVTSIIPVTRLRSEGDVSRAFSEQLLDGVVVISTLPDELRPHIEAMGSVVVWCDTNVDAPTGCVRRDEHHAGHTVATRLIEMGYQRLVWVGYAHTSGHYSTAARLGGVMEAARAYGVPVDSIKATAADLLPEGPALLKHISPRTALITENHHFAQSAQNVIGRAGFAPGEHYGLAACDHSFERSTVMPGLSHMLISRSAIGATTAAMLLQGMAPGGALPASSLVRGQWCEGTSTRRHV